MIAPNLGNTDSNRARCTPLGPTSLAVKDVGEPCAGEPHARIDGRSWNGTHTRHRAASYPTGPSLSASA
jgi:hypothetical protein